MGDLAQLSNNFVYSAILVYALAMLAVAAELALSLRAPASRVAAAGSPAAARVSRPAARVPAYAAAGGGSATTGGTVPEVTAASPAPGRGSDRVERLGRIGVSLTVLAFGLHLAAVVSRGLAAGRAPWGNMYEFSLTGGLAVTGVYLLLLRRYRARFLGIVIVPTVLLILGLAVAVLYAPATGLVPALQSYWLVIHVAVAILSSGFFTAGAALSALYLLRARAERRVGDLTLVRGWAARLPSAQMLDSLAYRVHAFVFPLFTFVLIAGAIWAERAWGRYWGWDPKETWSFITWVVYAGYLHARATAGWRGTRTAVVALVGYACFTFNYFAINLIVTGLHSYAF